MNFRTLFLNFCLIIAFDAEKAAASNPFIDEIPGDSPLVISAPHGGREKPSDIPNRTSGVTDADANTQELARTVSEHFFKNTGHRPHLIICLLHRSKLDANREIREAAQGNATAEKAWHEYHAAIARALAAAVARHGFAFFIDLHGQNHKGLRVELGYLHAAADLAQPDAVLDAPEFATKGSFQLVAKKTTVPYSALLKGPTSLGALLENGGFHSTPSPRLPAPDEPYFRGGYTVDRHVRGTADVTGLQIEANRTRLRDTAANRERFASILVPSLITFVKTHLQKDLSGL
jgi:N-formylglutamate amidohydrolase